MNTFEEVALEDKVLKVETFCLRNILSRHSARALQEGGAIVHLSLWSSIFVDAS
jgi:hypothetical protein